MHEYLGFDPLDAVLNSGNGINQKMLETAKKREIRNILKSYTGYFDLFSEAIQNALDSTEKIWRTNKSFKPILRIEIDLIENSITVSDNGTGMTQQVFEFCLAPNISFKSSDSLRGNKGVGATFLSYGYNNVKIHTKSELFEASVMLLGGRRWVDLILTTLKGLSF